MKSRQPQAHLPERCQLQHQYVLMEDERGKVFNMITESLSSKKGERDFLYINLHKY